VTTSTSIATAHGRLPGRGAQGLRPQVRFHLPPGRDATAPPEARGLRRDEVRLLVATPDGVTRSRFRDLATSLRAGDLLVVNTSATIPAAIDAHRRDGRPVVLHLAGPAPEGAGLVLVELREPDLQAPVLDGRPGEQLRLAGGLDVRLVTPFVGPHREHSGPEVTDRQRGPDGVRLWYAATLDGSDLEVHLRERGRPIAYGYVEDRWPLEAYQPVFAREPGSAEMASAGRPFTHALVTELITRGITLAPVMLHSAVSSPDAGEPPLPERFEVPAATVRLVDATRGAGRRVVAVGTTVTRALESAVDEHGVLRPASGWTELVLGPERPARVVTGLLTGWHAPEASHLALLEAVAGGPLVQAAYDTALEGDELWHEFGDSCLLLP
jgi:S-adenosylmethionine:tRNA ribosyltransferase-isomerase